MAASSTQARKQREFERREQLFLDQAGQLICEQGLLKLQMAKVAAGCDYATGTLYQHFESKEDLLLALSTRLAKDRLTLFARVEGWQAPPRHRLVAIVLADMLFAQRHPEHYRLMQYILTEVVWQAASERRRQEHLQANHPIGQIVGDIMNAAIECGDLDARDANGEKQNPYMLSAGPWALSMGMHSLVHAEGLLDLYDVRTPYRAMLMHIQMLLNGMGWKPCINPYDHQAVDQLIEQITEELFHDYCANSAG